MLPAVIASLPGSGCCFWLQHFLISPVSAEREREREKMSAIKCKHYSWNHFSRLGSLRGLDFTITFFFVNIFFKEDKWAAALAYSCVLLWGSRVSSWILSANLLSVFFFLINHSSNSNLKVVKNSGSNPSCYRPHIQWWDISITVYFFLKKEIRIMCVSIN